MKNNPSNLNDPFKSSSDIFPSVQKVLDGDIESAYSKIRELINDNKELRNQLENKSKKVIELTERNHKIVSVIAHDLRSPFNSILGFLELLKNNQAELDYSIIKNYLEIIYNTAINSLEMLDYLLDWATHRNKSKYFEPIPFNLHKLINEVLKVIMPLAMDKSIHIENLVPFNFIITADPNMLKTIIRNLSSNAVKFTTNNGTVTIKATRLKSSAEISVLDNGIGFPGEYLEHLFDKEHNHETSETNSDRWKGLGLMFCKEFIEVHGGDMSITSHVDKGTHIVFTIPQDSYS